jgi:hypothetical protein
MSGKMGGALSATVAKKDGQRKRKEDNTAE